MRRPVASETRAEDVEGPRVGRLLMGHGMLLSGLEGRKQHPNYAESRPEITAITPSS
jgi:hypothetical protein